MKKLKLLLFYFVAFNAALLFTGCSLSDDIAAITESLDSLKISVGTPRFTTGVNLVFVDAKSKRVIESKSITVTVNGKDAGSVHNNIGAKESPYVRNWGMLNLIIDPHKFDSTTLKENPLFFSIRATIDGYMPVDKEILIYEVGKQRVVVEMINEQNPPEGVIVQKFENVFTTANDGRVTKSSTINVFANSTSGAASGRSSVRATEEALFTIEIPEGVVLKGFNNEALVGQAFINVFNTEFSRDNQTYMQPEKITRNPKADNWNGYDHWYFPFSYRSVSITIIDKDGKWNPVASVENGHLILTTAIPTTFYNRETQKTIAENDILEKSYPYRVNWGNYKWDKVAKDTVKRMDNKFFLVEKVNKQEQLFCYWGYAKPICTTSWPWFNFNGNFKTNPNFLVELY
ncbi:MAG: hypothetical protein Q8T08_16525, partial [Ignavibacteria bacterium]|nr:hypothetical protein [Ignavibacteria bacterium]